ncbi:hypothetical protein LPW11_00350 [Geomonas sp. RF6]|uniref:hypothetical protein n=1 Tax=Geomonas sp. RF6 TaxID=2897342 RepID=UPI001E4BEFED|nr:hypothetical protein [Geomonas sp. RF6]UFS70657.1 hypothetical protein LPW11_00350 [Geomonas sp. RF6]
MLKLLQALFGSDEETGISEAIVKQAIERAVDGTDPWLRGVSGYRRKLAPAVHHALEHVRGLVTALSPPLPVTAASYDDPALKPFFISSEELRGVFANDRSLKEFRRAGGAATTYALLAMEKRETTSFGAELSGSIVLRDVPQVAVTFENHRLLDPSGDEGMTRRLLMRRAYDHLLSLALRRLTHLKGELTGLEKRRTLLQAKLNLLQEGEFGFARGSVEEQLAVADVEERLREIEAQLGELGGDDRVLESYLGTVTRVLGQAEEHLWATSETLFIDRMGIKRGPGAVPELTLAELRNTEGRTLVVLLVSLKGEEFCTIHS